MCAGPRRMTSRCECRDACGARVSAVGSMLQTSALWAWRLPRGLEHDMFNMYLMPTAQSSVGRESSSRNQVSGLPGRAADTQASMCSMLLRRTPSTCRKSGQRSYSLAFRRGERRLWQARSWLTVRYAKAKRARRHTFTMQEAGPTLTL